MTTKQTDSFGIQVDAGDYVYFRVKTRYGTDALSIGRIVKVSDKGSLSLMAINTYGKTIEQYNADAEAYYQKRAAEYVTAGKSIPDYLESSRSLKPYKQRLASASSCVRVPAHVLSPIMQQVLSLEE